MNITKELKDELNAVLKVQISKEDYEPKVHKVLNDYRKKAKIDGFRPGKVPTGMIQKLYGKTVMVEEINKLLSENLMKFIKDEKIHILGDPLPSEDDQKVIDWENQSEFEFVFEVGISPEFNISLNDKEKFVNYSIKPDKKLMQTYSDNYARRYGAFKSFDVIESGNEMLKGSLFELDAEGAKLEGGITVAESTIYLEFMKDEEIKKQFMGAKSGAVISFNLRKAFPNNTELSSILHLKKEEVVDLNSDFQYTILVISKFENAEINQELFDKAFGEGTINTIEEFNAKITEEISLNLSRESEYKFRIDAREQLVKQADFKLPVEFLKRWIFASNEGKFSKEQIEQDFSKFENDLKWQLIQNKLIKDNDLKITDEEILDFARAQTRMQFEQYGLSNVPEEHINNYAAESLKKEEDRRRLFDRKYEDKVLSYISKNVTMETKEVTFEEFDKLFEETNKQ